MKHQILAVGIKADLFSHCKEHFLKRDAEVKNLPTLPRIRDNVGNQKFLISRASRAFRYRLYLNALAGDSPGPWIGRFRVRSNTPDGVAFSLPLVARSRTSAREYIYPVKTPVHTVWGRRKLRCPSGVYRRLGLAGHSQYKNLPR